MSLLAKSIVFCGSHVVLACDGRCDLAWGIEKRPRKMLSSIDPDDFVYLGDLHPDLGAPPSADKLGCHGGDFKPSDVPLTSSEKMNRWCARECERSSLIEPALPDLKNPLPNKGLR